MAAHQPVKLALTPIIITAKAHTPTTVPEGVEPNFLAGRRRSRGRSLSERPSVRAFKPKELVARVRARLRGREDAQVEEGLGLQDLSIDVAGHIVKRDGRVIALTPLEFDLLVTLARAPWKVFSREELLEQVWGYRHAADTRLVNVHVQRLRSKIERDPERPELVVTVRGVGYRAGAGA